MKLKYYIVNAFITESQFSGNPAAVVILDKEIDSLLMQKIANQFNLSETAFCIAQCNSHKIRWFTPELEVDLCGHATLASAFVLAKENNLNNIDFNSNSGKLIVTITKNNLIMNFPKDEPYEFKLFPELSSILQKINIVRSFYAPNTKNIIIQTKETDLISFEPDFSLMKQIDIFPATGIILTAKSEIEEFDIVSRCFYPWEGIDEDYVTGSAHTALFPFWNKLYNIDKISAYQASQRGGKLVCWEVGDRIFLEGKANIFGQGEINFSEL